MMPLDADVVVESEAQRCTATQQPHLIFVLSPILAGGLALTLAPVALEKKQEARNIS